MASAGKFAISVVSLILVVGVVIGAIAVVRHGHNESQSAPISTKTATNFCHPAPYKVACLNSVQSVANNASATPMDYIIAALQATVQEVKAGLNVTVNLKIDQKKDPFHHMAVEDCKDMLGYAEKELQAAISTVGESQMHTLNDRVHELLNWLSAVYSYQSYCIDEFHDPQHKSVIQDGLLNATQLTHNAVDIIAKLSDVLKAFNIPLQQQTDSSSAGSKSRRLLQTHQIGHDGFPTWFQAADRKLLADLANGQVVPNAVVAQDGSGQFKTITDALKAYPTQLNGRYIIYVKAGVYAENVFVDTYQINVFIYGDGIGKTVVTGRLNFGQMGIQTSQTATFAALGDGFMAKWMTFQNTAGPEGHQAVALRIQADRSAVFECSMDSYQDTLYYQVHRQFYRDCVVYGTIDFIFGKGSAVIQNSMIIVRKGLPAQFNTVTSDGKELENDGAGLVLQNCSIFAGQDLEPSKAQVASYLGRPWKQFAKTVIMQSDIGDVIRPEGYIKWDGEVFETTCQYLEYSNRGAMGPTNTRDYKDFIRSRAIDATEAAQYTVNSFIQGGTWLPGTGVSYNGGL